MSHCAACCHVPCVRAAAAGSLTPACKAHAGSASLRAALTPLSLAQTVRHTALQTLAGLGLQTGEAKGDPARSPSSRACHIILLRHLSRSSERQERLSAALSSTGLSFSSVKQRHQEHSAAWEVRPSCRHQVTCQCCTQQERQEAQRLFETDPDALTADRTFEPGEGLVEAEGPAEDEEMAAVPEPTVRKGPTPEQITAIKVSDVPSG